MEPGGVPALQNRRAQRSRRAKETVTRSIPEILRTSQKARHGISKAELIVDPDANTHGATVSSAVRAHPRIRLFGADTLTAASRLSDRPFSSKRIAPTLKTASDQPNVAILSMASSLRPGGGFLEGANSQEEFICHRTTAYPALFDSFYPLPEIGGVYTPDVMVFRDATPEANDLQKRDRYFVDVITAGAFRFPDVRRGKSDEGLAGICSCGMSYCDRDRELVTRKMKAVMRIAQSKGVKKVVLGAWGCGALGNPVKDVAKLWRKVVAGSPRQRRPNAEQWDGIEEVVFAVPDPVMMREFHNQFDDIVAPDLPSPPPEEVQDDVTWAGAEMSGKDGEISGLVSRVQETEMQIEQMTNPRTKARLRDVLAALNRELARGRAAKASKDDRSDDNATPDADTPGPDDFVFANIPASDDDEGVYAFDDEASDSSDCPFSPAFEFKPLPPGLVETSQIETSHDEDEEDHENFYTVSKSSPRFDAKTGWFNGSIDEFHGFLKNGGQTSRQVSHSSPLLGPEGAAGSGGLEGLVGREYLGRFEGADVGGEQ